MAGIPSTSKKRQIGDAHLENSDKRKHQKGSDSAIDEERAKRKEAKKQKKEEKEAKKQRKEERARKREARAKKAAARERYANVILAQQSPSKEGILGNARGSESSQRRSEIAGGKTTENIAEQSIESLVDQGKQRKIAEQPAIDVVDGRPLHDAGIAEAITAPPKSRHGSKEVSKPSIALTGREIVRGASVTELPAISPKKRGRPMKTQQPAAEQVESERLNSKSASEAPASARKEMDKNSSSAGQDRSNGVEENVHDASNIEAIAPVAKKRGRPRKIVDGPDDVAETSTPSKRKPGRPKKTATDTTQLKRQLTKKTGRARDGGKISSTATDGGKQMPSPSTPRSEAQEKALFLAKFIGVEDQAILVEHLLDWKELRWLAEDRNLQYRTGPFTSWEDDQINGVLEAFRVENGWSARRFSDFLFGKRMAGEQPLFAEMWKKATAAVPGRPNRSVRSRVRRTFTPNSQKGAWTQNEEDMLAIAVDTYGSNWTSVASKVKRSAEDCRLRWRDQQHRQDQHSESWSEREREALRVAVCRHTPAPTPERPHPSTDWTKVCADLGNKRTRIQCVGRWRQEKTNNLREEEGLPAWNTSLHAAEFIRRIRKQKEALDKDDLKEVDMDKVTQGWHRWPARVLRMHWRELYDAYVRPVSTDPEAKRSVEDYDRELKVNLDIIEDGLKHIVQGTPKSSKSMTKGMDMISSDEEA